METARDSKGLVSIVIPVYNEAPSLPGLFDRLDEARAALGRPSEIILVDDGSRDGSFEKIIELAKGRPVTATSARRPPWLPASMRRKAKS